MEKITKPANTLVPQLQMATMRASLENRGRVTDALFFLISTLVTYIISHTHPHPAHDVMITSLLRQNDVIAVKSLHCSGVPLLAPSYYSCVIMSAMASQITGVSIVSSSPTHICGTGRDELIAQVQNEEHPKLSLYWAPTFGVWNIQLRIR